MKTPLMRRRPLLKTRMIGRYRTEILPDPFQTFFGLFDTA